MNRFIFLVYVSLPLCGLGLVLAAVAADDGEGAARQPALLKPANPRQRLREGMRFEGTGKVEISGDRATFVPDEGQESFRLLENLALERVVRVQVENRQPRQWQVSATVTEFQGANYLLLLRAVVKPAATKRETRTSP